MAFDARNPDDWADHPSYLASVRDRARDRRWEEARRQVKAMSKATPTAFEPLPIPPLHQVADIGPLYAKPKPRWQGRRSQDIDALLAKHGWRPKQRTRAEDESVMRTRKPKATSAREVWSGGETIKRSLGSVLRVR